MNQAKPAEATLRNPMPLADQESLMAAGGALGETAENSAPVADVWQESYLDQIQCVPAYRSINIGMFNYRSHYVLQKGAL